MSMTEHDASLGLGVLLSEGGARLHAWPVKQQALMHKFCWCHQSNATCRATAALDSGGLWKSYPSQKLRKLRSPEITTKFGSCNVHVGFTYLASLAAQPAVPLRCQQAALSAAVIWCYAAQPVLDSAASLPAAVAVDAGGCL